MSAIAIIPARGGSKRIPKKNIKEFLGKPIIAYSIEAALESGCFKEVMVSTDSPEIAKIAKAHGAKVPFYRNEFTSNDYATITDVLIEVVNKYKETGQRYERGCCIYPTAPFVSGDKLKKAMSLLDNNDTDTVIPVVAYSYPPQRGLVIKDKKLIMREPQHSRTRSQDLETMYHDAGQFCCFKTETLLRDGDLMKGTISPIIFSEKEVQDIDTIEDWELAELKYEFMYGR